MGDWRGDLLKAVSDVFSREDEGLLTAVRSHRSTGLLAPDTADRLERIVDEQVHCLWWGYVIAYWLISMGCHWSDYITVVLLVGQII